MSQRQLPRATPAGAASFAASPVVREDHNWVDQQRGRDVPVRIFAPAPQGGAGEFPLILVSHGGGESRDSFDYLGDWWARSGYIIVCVQHLGSDADAFRQVLNGDRAAESVQRKYIVRRDDIRFVQDYLRSKERYLPLVSGRINFEQLGICGQCAGSTYALGTAGLTVNLPGEPNVSFSDPRVKAVIALGPQLPYETAGGGDFGIHEQSWTTVRQDAPVLVVTGARDFSWIDAVIEKPQRVRMPYDRMPGTEKYLLELRDAEHHAFTDSTDPGYSAMLPLGPRDPRHHDAIRQTATAFLDAYLKDDNAAREWLRAKVLEQVSDGLCTQDARAT